MLLLNKKKPGAKDNKIVIMYLRCFNFLICILSERVHAHVCVCMSVSTKRAVPDLVWYWTRSGSEVYQISHTPGARSPWRNSHLVWSRPSAGPDENKQSQAGIDLLCQKTLAQVSCADLTQNLWEAFARWLLLYGNLLKALPVWKSRHLHNIKYKLILIMIKLLMKKGQ